MKKIFKLGLALVIGGLSVVEAGAGWFGGGSSPKPAELVGEYELPKGAKLVAAAAEGLVAVKVSGVSKAVNLKTGEQVDIFPTVMIKTHKSMPDMPKVLKGRVHAKDGKLVAVYRDLSRSEVVKEFTLEGDEIKGSLKADGQAGSSSSSSKFKVDRSKNPRILVAKDGKPVELWKYSGKRGCECRIGEVGGDLYALTSEEATVGFADVKFKKHKLMKFSGGKGKPKVLWEGFKDGAIRSAEFKDSGVHLVRMAFGSGDKVDGYFSVLSLDGKLRIDTKLDSHLQGVKFGEGYAYSTAGQTVKVYKL